jgi:DNA-binding transcriptional LysR family regulator
MSQTNSGHSWRLPTRAGCLGNSLSLYTHDMKLQQIRCFEAVVRTGSFRAAAKQLYLTQPAVSLHVSKLETELGCNLLVRTPKGSDISAAGRRLLPYFHAVLKAEAELLERAHGERSTDQQTVRLWSLKVIHDVLISRVVERLKTDLPKVKLEITLATSQEIVQALNDQACDIGIVRQTAPVAYDAGLTVLPLLVARPVVVAARDHPILRTPELTCDRFAEVPLVGWHEGLTMHNIFQSYLCETPTLVVATASSASQMHSLIRETRGIGLEFDFHFWHEHDRTNPLAFRYPDDLDEVSSFCALAAKSDRQQSTWKVLRMLQDEVVVCHEQLQANVLAHEVAAPV